MDVTAIRRPSTGSFPLRSSPERQSSVRRAPGLLADPLVLRGLVAAAAAAAVTGAS